MQQIDETLIEEFQVKQAMLDHLKVYINPEMYKKEHDIKDPYERVNSEFEQHSRTARLYGKPVLSDTMKKAIEESDAPVDEVVHVEVDENGDLVEV